MKGQKCYKGFYKTGIPNKLICCGSNGIEDYEKIYTIGKKHYHRGSLKMCHSGLHSCLYINLVDSFYHFSNRNTVICIVRPYGKIVGPEYGKLCSSALHVERRLNRKEILNELSRGLTLDALTSHDSLFLLYKLYSSSNRGIFSGYKQLYSQKNLIALRNGLLGFFGAVYPVYIASFYKPMLRYLLRLLVEHKIDGVNKMVKIVTI